MAIQAGGNAALQFRNIPTPDLIPRHCSAVPAWHTPDAAVARGVRMTAQPCSRPTEARLRPSSSRWAWSAAGAQLTKRGLLARSSTSLRSSCDSANSGRRDIATGGSGSRRTRRAARSRSSALCNKRKARKVAATPTSSAELVAALITSARRWCPTCLAPAGWKVFLAVNVKSALASLSRSLPTSFSRSSTRSVVCCRRINLRGLACVDKKGFAGKPIHLHGVAKH